MKVSKLIGKISAKTGNQFTMENGDKVILNFNHQSQVGDTINYAEIRSIKNVKMQAGNTQWIEAKEIGNKFFKQI